ncbi:LOB domain-containing protein 30-like [Cicer arietinum]|uniref:LOB domain-containing protein 30-like n=1 Tax=Cicer arietinum TaxID=3827 RepID=A0A1S2YWA9_CICAR|nr:LOB domain-containing protein 30-like [Cicer arietinum]
MSINSSCSGSGGGCGGGNSGACGPCGACKFLRRKCLSGCIFAPYFDSEQGASHFAAVHKVFGASNVSKLLQNVPVHKRLDAVITICYEAQARMRDPVYGCVAHIFTLQQQVVSLQAELSYLQGHIATYEVPQPPKTSPPQATIAPSMVSLANLPLASSSSINPATYDLSSLFDPMAQTSSWAMHQRPNGQYFGSGTSTSNNSGGDLQSLARELLLRYGSSNDPSSNSLSK